LAIWPSQTAGSGASAKVKLLEDPAGAICGSLAAGAVTFAAAVLATTPSCKVCRHQVAKSPAPACDCQAARTSACDVAVSEPPINASTSCAVRVS
jgi:hypothetical protein